MLENIIFEFYRGDTYTRDFTITGWSFPISNVYFTAKIDADNKKACLQKSLNDGITIVDETEEGITYNLLLNCVDTDCLKYDVDYEFDVEIVSNVGENTVKKTVIKGILRLKQGVTRPCNEV